MAKRFSTLSLFLLSLLVFQGMMLSEAVICSSPSRLFTGLCFSDNNCSAICEKEGFLSGVCKGLKCVCQNDCNGGGGGGGGGGAGAGGSDGGDPGQGPPAMTNRKYLINP